MVGQTKLKLAFLEKHMRSSGQDKEQWRATDTGLQPIAILISRAPTAKAESTKAKAEANFTLLSQVIDQLSRRFFKPRPTSAKRSKNR